MPRIRIFISFDGDRDTDLYEQLHAQAMRPETAFTLGGHSLDGPMNEAWTESSRARIRAADEVVIICGEHTNASPRVAAELRIAQEEGKPYVLLWGRRERMCTKPIGAKPSDAMYSWTRDILENQLSTTLREAKPLEVPENCKRP